jgi:dTDP-4-dehydrorhamnose reductase
MRISYPITRNDCVLITGGSGLLALNWACAVRDDWKVVLGTHKHSVKLPGTISCQLNLEDPKLFSQQLDQVAPDLIVHTAGLASVDRCEREPEQAHRVNAVIARNVAVASACKKIPLIHISTDHLFAGKQSFYQETHQPEPINEYARSKLLGEEWARLAYPQVIIIRTNFFGWGHAERLSFSDTIIYNLRAGKALNMFDDVFFTPILADPLALVAHKLAKNHVSGIFNIVGDERLSKYQFALRLAKAFGLPAELIHRGMVGQDKQTVMRPMDMSLSNEKVHKILGQRLGNIDEFLYSLKNQDSQGRCREILNSVFPGAY